MDDNSKYIGAYADLLTQVAENVEAVYAAGVKSEYDRYWDACQDYGAKKECAIRFWDGWNDDNFKPKYTIYAGNGTFTEGVDRSGCRTIQVEDLRESAIGVTIDWSLCTVFNYILRYTPVKYIDTVDMTNASYGTYLFAGARQLEYIEKVILPPTVDLAFRTHGFNHVTKLQHIDFENKFLSAVTFSACINLTHESLINILNALYDYVNGDLDGSSKNKTCTLGATNLAKLTDAEKAIATEKGWTLA